MVKKISEAAAIKDVFGKAVVAEKPKKAEEHKVVEMGDEVAHYVALAVASKTIKPLEDLIGGRIKQEATIMFLDTLIRTKTKPEAFTAVHGDSSIQIQFKAATSISAEVAERCQKSGVTLTTAEKVPERFVINPAIFADQEKLGKLAVALQGLGIADIIQKQESSVSYKVADSTFADIANLKDPVERAELMRAVSTLAIAQVALDGVQFKADAETAETASTKAFAFLSKAGIISAIKNLVKKK